MKKLLFVLALLMPILTFAQPPQPHLMVMGIALGQDSTVFASRLIDRGFIPVTADNGKWHGFQGDFWKLSNCKIVLKTDKDHKVDRVAVLANEADYHLMSPLFKSLTSKYDEREPTFIDSNGDWFKCMWLAGPGVIEMNCMGDPVNIFQLTYYDAQAALEYLKAISSKLDDL